MIEFNINFFWSDGVPRRKKSKAFQNKFNRHFCCKTTLKIGGLFMRQELEEWVLSYEMSLEKRYKISFILFHFVMQRGMDL